MSALRKSHQRWIIKRASHRGISVQSGYVFHSYLPWCLFCSSRHATEGLHGSKIEQTVATKCLWRVDGQYQLCIYTNHVIPFKHEASDYCSAGPPSNIVLRQTGHSRCNIQKLRALLKKENLPDREANSWYSLCSVQQLAKPNLHFFAWSKTRPASITMPPPTQAPTQAPTPNDLSMTCMNERIHWSRSLPLWSTCPYSLHKNADTLT